MKAVNLIISGIITAIIVTVSFIFANIVKDVLIDSTPDLPQSSVEIANLVIIIIPLITGLTAFISIYTILSKVELNEEIFPKKEQTEITLDLGKAFKQTKKIIFPFGVKKNDTRNS